MERSVPHTFYYFCPDSSFDLVSATYETAGHQAVRLNCSLFPFATGQLGRTMEASMRMQQVVPVVSDLTKAREMIDKYIKAVVAMGSSAKDPSCRYPILGGVVAELSFPETVDLKITEVSQLQDGSGARDYERLLSLSGSGVHVIKYTMPGTDVSQVRYLLTQDGLKLAKITQCCFVDCNLMPVNIAFALLNLTGSLKSCDVAYLKKLVSARGSPVPFPADCEFHLETNSDRSIEPQVLSSLQQRSRKVSKPHPSIR